MSYVMYFNILGEHGIRTNQWQGKLLLPYYLAKGTFFQFMLSPNKGTYKL